MTKRVVLFLLSGATLCLTAPPAAASFIDLHFVGVQSKFILDPGGTTGAFEAAKIDGLTMGNVTRLSPAPTSVGGLLWGLGLTGGDFSLTMALENISAGALTATGSGQFTITDTTGDRITGKLQGAWTRTGGQANVFQGTLFDVAFDNAHGDNQFNGHLGSAADMSLTLPPPWIGVITELSATADWFSAGSYTTNSGSVDASVVVPVPGALGLTLFGLGLLGVGRRKHV